MHNLLQRYRRSINPPWNIGDFFNLVLTLTVLLAIPFAIVLTQNTQSFRSQAQTADTTEPTYPCCTKPDPMEVITRPVTIIPNVYDESGVAKVELRFRDPQDPINRLGTQYVFTDTEAPFQFPWDSTLLPDGRQRYDVFAWDIYGNGGNNYLNAGFLAMNEPNYPPISLITPTVGSTVSGIVPIELSSSANLGIRLVSVDLQSPGGGFSTIAGWSSGPYRFEWESNRYTDGPHRFRVRAFENDPFMPGDLGDPGELQFELCVRTCVLLSPTPTSTPTPTPTSTPTPTPTSTKYGTITGTVFNQDGIPIQGAKVTLRINNRNTTYTTDAQGKYLIPNVPPGTYTITYVAAGYSQQKTTATVTAGTTLVINVTLKRR